MLQMKQLGSKLIGAIKRLPPWLSGSVGGALVVALPLGAIDLYYHTSPGMETLYMVLGMAATGAFIAQYGFVSQKGAGKKGMLASITTALVPSKAQEVKREDININLPGWVEAGARFFAVPHDVSHVKARTAAPAKPKGKDGGFRKSEWNDEAAKETTKVEESTKAEVEPNVEVNAKRDELVVHMQPVIDEITKFLDKEGAKEKEGKKERKTPYIRLVAEAWGPNKDLGLWAVE